MAETACWVMVTFLVLLNLAASQVVVVDKRRAQRYGGGADRTARRANVPAGQRQRVPERAFHMMALFGGGLGALLAMLWVRHKTRKTLFLVPFLTATVVGTAVAGMWLWALCS